MTRKSIYLVYTHFSDETDRCDRCDSEEDHVVGVTTNKQTALELLSGPDNYIAQYDQTKHKNGKMLYEKHWFPIEFPETADEVEDVFEEVPNLIEKWKNNKELMIKSLQKKIEDLQDEIIELQRR